MSLKAKCKLFKTDLHNMTPEAMAQAGKNIKAIVEGCGMVLGDPARAQREGKTCVTAHNYRAGGCIQAPGGCCANIRPSERSVAIEIDAIVDSHEGCRGLDVCGRIAACVDAQKDLECAYDMAHLSMVSTARGGTAANMSTNLMHSCNSLLTAGGYGEEPSQEVLFAAYDHVAADRKDGHRPSSEYNSEAGCFVGANGAHVGEQMAALTRRGHAKQKQHFGPSSAVDKAGLAIKGGNYFSAATKLREAADRLGISQFGTYRGKEIRINQHEASALALLQLGESLRAEAEEAGLQQRRDAGAPPLQVPPSCCTQRTAAPQRPPHAIARHTPWPYPPTRTAWPRLAPTPCAAHGSLRPHLCLPWQVTLR